MAENENTENVVDNPTGPIALRARVQLPRAPLTPLETSRTDAVAEYFRQRGEEPSYEAIAEMAPPLKYVNALFRVYPLVLGDKDGATKVRLLSDARELHLDVSLSQPGAGADSGGEWEGGGQKLLFHVGDGKEIQNAQPRWRNGYLPVAEFEWEQDGARYSLEAFATLLPDTTHGLCAWLRVRATRLRDDATVGFGARFEGETPVAARDGYLVHEGEGTAESPHRLRAGFSGGWEFDTANQTLNWRLPDGEEEGEACLVVVNQPAIHGLFLEAPGERVAFYGTEWGMDLERSREDSGLWLAQWAQPESWRKVRDEYCRAWDDDLSSGAQVETPEAIVNSAQKSVRVASRIIATRNQMSYSTQTLYERLYTDEAAQVIVGLAYWGHAKDAARYLGQTAFYTQNGHAAHELGIRLHWFCRYHALSGDDEFLERNRARMKRWAYQLIDSLSDEHHGLTPPARHSGDLHHLVHSLPANSDAWRGIRDFALLSEDTQLQARAEKYRRAIIAAVEASMDTSTAPPFVPVSLYGDEPTPDTLTEKTLSAYWSLMAPYAMYSGVLTDEHAGAQAMLDTFDGRGGLCAGLVRMTIHDDYSKLTILLELGLDDLYGAKLAEVWARRDRAEQLVLALYGKLGLGLTHDTFICGEGASLAPSRIFGDESSDGRSFYLPPNSASQMMFAIVLRHCLVFDFDSQGDGVFDTLRLAFSTPRGWMEEGKRLSVKKMPTSFGEVSYELVSHLDSQNAVEATVELPSRCAARSTLLRLRAPVGRRLKAVWIDGQSHAAFDAGQETIDLSQFSGEIKIRAEYS